MRRLGAAIVVGTAVGLVGFSAGSQLDVADNGNAAILIGFLSGAAGFLVTLGFASDVLLRFRGRPGSPNFKRSQGAGWTEYLGISLDHKVVGIQFALGAVLIAVALILVSVL
ncbi:MAG TPA: hypothetical protein VNH82_06280 [Candidatus Dormibacteraeota bacterium]|nr:hypothetical protein [Candidatus Dormibacteraeota bacterium]